MKLSRVVRDTMKVLEAGLRVAGAATRTPARTLAEASSGSHGTVAAHVASSDEQEASCDERALFLSVKPHYANAILDGKKTVELRRTRPSLPDGSLVILYSSTPTRAVVGWAQLAGVRQGTPGEIWHEFGAAAAIAEPEYDVYFDGSAQAFALELGDVVAASQPVPLSAIRSMGIQPPQSWRYVPTAVSTEILKSAAL